jgi:primosomal protein N' (replication factor Y)
MKNAESYEKMLNSFKRGDIDILIGTQMIAKGLHFPNVTLVGIIHADHGLMMPDFRASERTFQLITQVAGRAGRGEIRGEVMLQTYNPANETIRFAAADDYESFYNFDMSVREMLKFPPFGHLMTVHFKSENEAHCLQYAEYFKSELMEYIHNEVQISGPSPAPIERIKGKFRYQILIKGNKLKTLREAVRILILHRTPPANVEFYADVDPQSLL